MIAEIDVAFDNPEREFTREECSQIMDALYHITVDLERFPIKGELLKFYKENYVYYTQVDDVATEVHCDGGVCVTYTIYVEILDFWSIYE